MSDFTEACYQTREALKEHEKQLKELRQHVGIYMGHDPEDVKSNVVLALRHLEDCRMRLGKAIQAYDGGISVYQR